MRSGADVEPEGLARNLHSSSSQASSMVTEVRARCQPVKFFHTKLIKPCLCSLCIVHRRSHIGIETVAVHLAAQHSRKYHGMLKQEDGPSLEIKALKNGTIPLFLLCQTAQLAQGTQANNVLPESTKPRLV